MTLNLTSEQVKSLLKKANQTIVEEKRSTNNIGIVLKLANGCIVNCWDKGTVSFQGKNVDQIISILSEAPALPIHNRKVFVVYGHDNNARTQLEATKKVRSKIRITTKEYIMTWQMKKNGDMPQSRIPKQNPAFIY